MSNLSSVKRASVLFPIFIIIAMVAAACGSSESDAPTQTPATSVPATAAPPTATTPPPTVGPTGTLEVRVTDQPADDPTEIVLTIENVEVHRSGGDDESGWQMVAEGPFEFDLLKLDGIEEILGEAELEVGRYQQIRLNVGPGTGFPPIGGQGRDPRRPFRGRLRGRTVRDARGRGPFAGRQPEPASGRTAGGIRLRSAEPGWHPDAGGTGAGHAGEPGTVPGRGTPGLPGEREYRQAGGGRRGYDEAGLLPFAAFGVRSGRGPGARL